MMRVIIDRYEVIFDDKKPPGDRSPMFYATRDGKYWRDLTGDKLIFSLALKLNEDREKIIRIMPQLETALIELRQDEHVYVSTGGAIAIDKIEFVLRELKELEHK